MIVWKASVLAYVPSASKMETIKDTTISSIRLSMGAVTAAMINPGTKKAFANLTLNQKK